MARNAAHTLTPAEVTLTNANRARYAALIGQPVSLTYVKRDGTPSTLSGVVVELAGTRKGLDSTECVTLDTERGPRSANLWTVTPA